MNLNYELNYQTIEFSMIPELSAAKFLDTPVAFIVFNRPLVTQQVFNSIRDAKPRQLFVIADGPRHGNIDDEKKCKAVRRIIEQVDWDCKVSLNYSEINLGCRDRVTSGLDWVFDQVDEAIILEDDCLPHPSFFVFSAEMLARYRNDQRVGMISGVNFLFNRVGIEESYYFSKYVLLWGWATWARAWKFNDREATCYPEFIKKKYLYNLFPKALERKFWNLKMRSVYEKSIDTWDYQWIISFWRQGFLSIIPSVNLISNIGFGVDATHTHDMDDFAEMKTEEIKFPLIHPSEFLLNYDAERHVAKEHFTYPSLVKRIINKIKFFLVIK